MATKDEMNAAAEAVMQDSDRSLAELVLGGDESAFRLLYRRHSPRLYLLVLRMLGGQEADAEDVVQDTWLKATERLDTFRWEASFGSWLCAIGLNVARESLRKKGKREEQWSDETDAAGPAPRDKVDPLDLERALRGLPDGYRTVLLLHDVEGYRHDEIAERLGISAGTSKSQLFHARRSMRAALDGYGKDQAHV
jgi:RNA polymerase sigma-70 factor (ECF subfamily)